MEKLIRKLRYVVVICLCVMFAVAAGYSGGHAAMQAFDINKMSDMSDYNPATFVNPQGDVVKIGVVEAFSGPSAFNGQIFWLAN